MIKEKKETRRNIGTLFILRKSQTDETILIKAHISYLCLLNQVVAIEIVM